MVSGEWAGGSCFVEFSFHWGARHRSGSVRAPIRAPSVSEGLPWLGSKRLCRNPLADARGSDWRIPHRSGSLDWPALVQGLHFQVAHPLSLFDTLGLPGMLDNAPPVIVAAVETTVVLRRWARWSGSAGTPSPRPPSTRLAQHWPAARVRDFVNRLGACIASRPGATPAWEIGDLQGMEMREESTAPA